MNNQKLSKKWEEKEFKDCLETDSVPSAIKIKKSEFKEKGKFPIIDQGEKQIAGYCDDKSKLYPYGNPVVIFGDHTKRIKYADFSFCVGADGTKVLLPKKDLLNAKFMYYQLKYLPLESGGYSRHYRFLKRKKLIVPPMPIQKQIVSILEQAEKLKEKRNQVNEETNKILKNVFHEIFGGPAKNEKQWPKLKLKDIAKLDMGGTPNKKFIEYFEKGTINWMKSGNIKSDYIINVPNKITKLGLKNSNAKLYKIGDVVIALNGQGKTRGTTGILKVNTTSNQSVASISPDYSKITSEYLHVNLKTRYNELRNITGDGFRSGLNLTILRNLEIVTPPLDLQKKFSLFFDSLMTLKYKQSQSTEEINILFDCLMQKAFKGGFVN